VKPSKEVDQLIADYPSWEGEKLTQFRKLIHQAIPDVVEEVKWKKPSNPAGVPVFYHDGIVCILGVLKERVRLTIPAGATLKDPKKIFNACLDAGSMRAIDSREDDKIDGPGVKALLIAAAKQNAASSSE
jgi:hypothetical protein